MHDDEIAGDDGEEQPAGWTAEPERDGHGECRENGAAVQREKHRHGSGEDQPRVSRGRRRDAASSTWAS